MSHAIQDHCVPPAEEHGGEEGGVESPSIRKWHSCPAPVLRVDMTFLSPVYQPQSPPPPFASQRERPFHLIPWFSEPLPADIQVFGLIPNCPNLAGLAALYHTSKMLRYHYQVGYLAEQANLHALLLTDCQKAAEACQMMIPTRKNHQQTSVARHQHNMHILAMAKRSVHYVV